MLRYLIDMSCNSVIIGMSPVSVDCNVTRIFWSQTSSVTDMSHASVFILKKYLSFKFAQQQCFIASGLCRYVFTRVAHVRVSVRACACFLARHSQQHNNGDRPVYTQTLFVCAHMSQSTTGNKGDSESLIRTQFNVVVMYSMHN